MEIETSVNEGWYGDDYFILFSEAEAISASERYRIAAVLQGYSVVGLRGWDDLIVRDANGRTYTIPAMPLDSRHLAPCAIPDATSLQPDARFAGRIKWYVKPLALGGDALAEENRTWVTHREHSALVLWWNERCRSLQPNDTDG